MLLAAVGLGGFAGTVARYWLVSWIGQKEPSSFPAGTMAVNVAGSFLLGMLVGTQQQTALVTPTLYLALSVGFLGAFTTFSSWMVDSIRLIREGSYLTAAANLLASTTMGLVAAGSGMALGRLL